MATTNFLYTTGGTTSTSTTITTGSTYLVDNLRSMSNMDRYRGLSIDKLNEIISAAEEHKFRQQPRVKEVLSFKEELEKETKEWLKGILK